MSLYTAALYFFAALCMAPALAAFFTANLVRTAYLFFASLVGVAGLYALSGNDFVAAAQIVVYVGGILILILFGIMLSVRVWRNRPASGRPADRVLGAAAGIAVFFALARFIPSRETSATVAVRDASVTAIGTANMTGYLPLFEAASFLLLAALIGAATLTRKS
ncbi:MAG: NADH-quinone oxidoreductase subunit J [Bacteroidia bacterium]|nr:NADH-quinone oxidoreductase subunit J [Bacteroidia bacterium]